MPAFYTIWTPPSPLPKEANVTLKIESQFCTNLALAYPFKEIISGCSKIMQKVAALLTKICTEGFEEDKYLEFPNYFFTTEMLEVRTNFLTTFTGEKVYVQRSFYQNVFNKIDNYIAIAVNEATDFVGDIFPKNVVKRFPYLLHMNNVKPVKGVMLLKMISNPNMCTL